MTSEFRWGVFAPAFDPLGTGSPPLLDATRLAAELNFHTVWVGDHLIGPAPVFDSICSLAAMAGVTSTIQLGLGVLQLGLRNLVWTAKQLSTLEAIAPGRLRLGVGVGGEFPDEFTASGVSLKTRGRRLDEILQLLNPLLAGEAVSYKSDEIAVEVSGLRPVISRQLPLAVGGRSDAALNRAARFGDEWLGMWYDPEAVQQRVEKMSEMAEKWGRPTPSVGMIILTNVNNDREKARDETTRYLRGQYNLPFHVVEKWTACGPADEVVDMLSLYQKVGVSEFVLAPAAINFLDQYEKLAQVRQLLG